MKSKPSVVQQGLVIFVKNKERVSEFYQQALGLTVQESARSHDLLVGNGYEIVVHTIPPKHAKGIKVSRPRVLRANTPLKPTFVVPSLETVREAASATGGYLNSAEASWHFRGFTVLDGCDPEGNVIQFRERKRSRSR